MCALWSKSSGPALSAAMPRSWQGVWLFGCLLSTLVNPPLPLAAQEAVERAETEAERSLGPTGMKLGPFDLDLGLDVGVGYTDNVFATRNDRQTDRIFRVSPNARLDYDSAGGRFAMRAGADLARYDSNTKERYNDWWVGGGGAIDVGRGLEIFGDASFAHLHEPRTSPDEQQGTEPTTYFEGNAVAGFNWRTDKWTTRLGSTLTRLDYQDATVNIDNNDRDMLRSLTGGRVSRAIAPGQDVFVQGFVDNRRYDQTPDDNGANRDSDGFNAAVGYRLHPSARLDAEFFLGYLRQDYVDLGNVSDPDLGARVRWRPDAWTKVDLTLDRQVYETTLAGSPAYVGTLLLGGIERHLSPRVTANAQLGYFQDHYQSVSRDDDGWLAGLEGRYYLSPRTYLALGYDLSARRSNDPDEDYVENIVSLSVGSALAPNPASTAGLTPMPQIKIDGEGYLGLLAIKSMLQTSFEGPRGGDGSLTADFGDGGSGAGLVAGYGFDFAPWYLGAEIVGTVASSDWEHSRSPGGREFSVDRREGFELAGRLGYRVPAHALFYARAAGARTVFRSRYEGDGFSDRETETKLGLGGGLGIDLLLPKNRFLRAEYGVMSYGDYDLVNDNFANRESQFRLGYGLRFGAKDADEDISESIREHRLDGFHFGVSAGHGMVDTSLSGARQAGSTLNADYGDDSVMAGLFAGYDLRPIESLTVGVEINADVADGRFGVQRDPDNREWSVDRRDSVGAALRAGLVIADRAVLYAKAGIVSTAFRTKYSLNNDNFEDDKRQIGFQYGVGVEVPVNKKMFVRLDYTQVDYDSYQIDFGAASDKFNNDEARASIGVGWRF